MLLPHMSRFVLPAWLSLFCCSGANAALTLTLHETSGANLSNLSVGQPLNIEVLLSGLPPSPDLGYLAATVDFSSSLLGSSSNVLPGPIVPDITGFLGTPGSGFADASYDFLFAVSGDPI